MATAIVCVILAGIVGLIVWKMIRDKRAGKSACSCGCTGSCPGCKAAAGQKNG